MNLEIKALLSIIKTNVILYSSANIAFSDNIFVIPPFSILTHSDPNVIKGIKKATFK